MTHAAPAREERSRGRRSPLVLGGLAVLALAGIAALMALGIWQLERRVWKLQLIDQVERRIHATPAAAPGPDAWPAIDARDAYRRVSISGRFDYDRETLVQAVTAQGSGYWVLTPLRAVDGFTVLVNRGFVPPDRRERAARGAVETQGVTTVTGLLRVTEPKGAFLRANDPQAGRWYSRDVAAIARSRDLDDVAPYFIDAEATSGSSQWPVGGLTVIAFPNNHMVYALTWFGLALMLAGWFGFVVFDEWRFRRNNIDSAAGIASRASAWDPLSRSIIAQPRRSGSRC